MRCMSSMWLIYICSRSRHQSEGVKDHALSSFQVPQRLASGLKPWLILDITEKMPICCHYRVSCVFTEEAPMQESSRPRPALYDTNFQVISDSCSLTPPSHPNPAQTSRQHMRSLVPFGDGSGLDRTIHSSDKKMRWHALKNPSTMP